MINLQESYNFWKSITKIENDIVKRYQEGKGETIKTETQIFLDENKSNKESILDSVVCSVLNIIFVCGRLCVMNNRTRKSKLKLLDKKHFTMIIGCQN